MNNIQSVIELEEIRKPIELEILEENNKPIEPEIVDAIEHVPCCRKCCDELVRNNDNSKRSCRECYKTHHIKWVECGKNADKKCISCCKLNFGVLLQQRCPQPCFEDCNESALCILKIFSIIFFPAMLVVVLIIMKELYFS
jgi:hypothetical protein